MNRRLMMAQQNKGFELVYDAASGELPQASDGWDITLDSNTTATVQNGYLRITGDGSYLWGRLQLKINKKQNLNKSRSITCKIGNIKRMTLTMRLTDYEYFLEKYPHNLIQVYKTFGQNLYLSTSKEVSYKTASIIYDAITKTVSFYLDDKLLYATDKAISKEISLNVSGADYFEISQITYKEW